MSTTTFEVQAPRRQLHDKVREDVPFDKKAGDALEVGTEYLGATHGYLVQMNQETNHCEVVVATDDSVGPVPHRPEQNPAERLCRDVLEEQTSTGLDDYSADELRTEPIYKHDEEHWYLGVPLVHDDERYGTVCFVGEGAPSVATDDEFLFADHLTRLLERELARDQVESKLSNQTNLATVLNRVLRHNLRNDMSVIRGYTEVIADQLDDDSEAETILTHVDNLIDLSEKARTLEQILSASSERQLTDVAALSRNIAEEVAGDYPDASIAVESEDEIQTGVMPSFRQALAELLTNAVKHTGREPTVTVTVETVSNDIEIRIKDDGPGLPEAEQNVLESGAEDPLTHGSGLGLWIAHWIVTSHDGSIDTAVTEHGTTMTVSVPRKPTVGVRQQLLDLTRSRDKYKAAFEGTTDAITIVDDEGRILEANGAAGEIFGMEPQELIGRPQTEFLPDEAEFNSEWRTLQQAGIQRDTVRVIGADREERVLEYSAIADIIPGQHLFVSRDITERRERERELEETKQRLGLAIEGTDTGVWEWDIETDELFWSESTERLFGLDPGTFEGTYAAFKERVHPDDREKLEDTIGACLENDEPFELEYRIHRNDGTERWVEGRGELHDTDGTRQMVGVLTDITERRERERQIKRKQARFKAVFDDAFDPMVIADDDGQYIEVNESATELFGIPEEELFGRAIHEFAPADFDFEAAWSDFQKSEDDRGTFPLVRADGSERIVEYAASRDIVPGEHLSILRDITERKERERELRTRTQAMEKAPIGMTLSDPSQSDNPMVYTNERFCELSGYEESEILGRNCRFMQGPETDSEPVAEIRTAIDNEEPVSTVLRNYRKDGTTFWNHVTIAPIRDDEGAVNRWIGFQADVSDRVERQQQLELAETVFENTQDALFVVDVADDGTFFVQRVNDVYEQLTGISNAEIAGKTPTEVVGEEIGGEIESHYRDCVERRETIQYFEEIPVDGEPRQWETKVTPITDAGSVEKLVGAMRDVTGIQNV